MEQKKMVEGDFIDPKTGLRFVEDIRGNLHCVVTSSSSNPGTNEINITIPEIKIPEVPPAEININITPPTDDPEKQRLIRITEALRSENNWLWEVIMTAIIDRKKSGGAPKAMDALEQKIKERQRA